MKGWRDVLTYGYSLDLYARGNQRRGVDRESGKVVLKYTFNKKGGLQCQR